MIGKEDLILVILAVTIGYITNELKPKQYIYQDNIVVLNKNIQCPTYCGVIHPHNVYFTSETNGMTIDESLLGKQVKIKKKKRKK